MKSLPPLIGCLLLATLFGYTTGRIVHIHIAYSEPQIQLVPDMRPTIPVISIEGIHNGYLEGVMSSGARLFIGGDLIIPNTSGAFRTPADLFLVNNVHITVPEGMYFVASKKGKKYYPVTSSSASQLAPQNRVYFRTEEEASQHFEHW